MNYSKRWLTKDNMSNDLAISFSTSKQTKLSIVCIPKTVHWRWTAEMIPKACEQLKTEYCLFISIEMEVTHPNSTLFYFFLFYFCAGRCSSFFIFLILWNVVIHEWFLFIIPLVIVFKQYIFKITLYLMIKGTTF